MSITRPLKIDYGSYKARKQSPTGVLQIGYSQIFFAKTFQYSLPLKGFGF